MCTHIFVHTYSPTFVSCRQVSVPHPIQIYIHTCTYTLLHTHCFSPRKRERQRARGRNGERKSECVYTNAFVCILSCIHTATYERWGAGVETQKNVRGEIGGWGRVPFNEPYAPSLSTIYDGA